MKGRYGIDGRSRRRPPMDAGKPAWASTRATLSRCRLQLRGDGADAASVRRGNSAGSALQFRGGWPCVLRSGGLSANPTAQEVLAYPVRQGTMASTAMPGTGMAGVVGSDESWISRGPGAGNPDASLSCVSSPITALPFGVGMTAAQAGLIAAPRQHGPNVCVCLPAHSAVQ
jgi:hypothetical protein